MDAQGATLRRVTSIDVTPTWTGLLPALLDVIRNEDAPVESLLTVHDELIKMAKAADLYIEYMKEHSGE
jgi:hypothetical protein